MPAEAKDVLLLCLDVDGVLTDGTINLDDRGVETKKFHVRDGTAIRLWMSMGYHVAMITGRTGMAARHRAQELGIKHLVQGEPKKLPHFQRILAELSLEPHQAAMLGDDLPDLPIMNAAGYPMAVSDAVAEVRAAARFVTVQPGGHAAVREAVEHLLKAKGQWERAGTMFE